MLKFSKSQKRFLGLLLTLAIPIALQNLLTCSMSVIDILMVGQLNETAIAAVGIANQFVFMLFVLSFYNISPATYENAYYLMLVSGLIFWAKTTNFTTIVSVLRSGGDTQFGFLLDLTGAWCIGVPMAFFTAFYLGLPVYWVMALVAVEELFKLGVGIPRFFSQKWIRNLVAV